MGSLVKDLGRQAAVGNLIAVTAQGRDFDAQKIEILPVQLLTPYDFGTDKNTGACAREPIWQESDLYLADMWTVYGHCHAGGVEALTDTTTQRLAMAIRDKFEREHMGEMMVAKQIREANQLASDTVH